MQLIVIVEDSSQSKPDRFIPAEDINHITVGMVLNRIDNIGIDFAPVNQDNTEWQCIQNIRKSLTKNEDSVLLKDI